MISSGTDRGDGCGLSQPDVGHAFTNNLLPVTIGNIIGGALLVGLVYWFIYLRPGWTGTPGEREKAPARGDAMGSRL